MARTKEDLDKQLCRSYCVHLVAPRIRVFTTVVQHCRTQTLALTPYQDSDVKNLWI